MTFWRSDPVRGILGSEGVRPGKPQRPEPDRDLIQEAREELADAFNYLDWKIERCRERMVFPIHLLAARKKIVEAFDMIEKHEQEK